MTAMESDVQGWAGLGWANFRAGKLEPAAVAFGQLVERYPESPLAAEAAVMRAKALQQAGRSEDALEAYLLAVTNYGKSEQAVPAMLEAARLLEKSGRKADAIPLLRRIVQESPKQASLDGVLYQLAWLLSDQGQADEADRLFQQISAEYPDSDYWADATYRLAQRAASTRQYERARQFADQLTPANCTPELLEHALFLQGQLAASTQRWQNVVGPLQELLTRFAEQPSAVNLQAAVAGWPADGPAAHFAQRHFLRILARYEDPEWWRQPEVFRRCLSLRTRAAELGVPSDRSLFYWLRARIQAGDAARQTGEDCLLAGDPASAEARDAAWSEAEGHYQAAGEIADLVPNSQLEMVPGCTHMNILQHPRTIAAIREYLEK